MSQPFRQSHPAQLKTHIQFLDGAVRFWEYYYMAPPPQSVTDLGAGTQGTSATIAFYISTVFFVVLEP